MIRQLRFAAVALLLASCSTVLDGQIQDVTIETSGASNTLCYMQNKEFSFRFYPPQTLKVTKSDDPYTIRCLAPGNREKTVIIEPSTTDNTLWNVTNAGTGLVIDHLSSAMYELPDKIVINFEGMLPGGYTQPAYNTFYDKNPHLKGVEEFRPGQAALLRDAGTGTPSLQKRETGDDAGAAILGGGDPLASTNGNAGPSATVTVESVLPPPVPAGSQGMSAESLTRSMNPQVFGGASAPAASGAPVSMSP